MIITTKAIVLSAIKYGDSSLIVRLFTESDGMKSYMVRGVLSSRKGKFKKGYFQPLTILEVVANHRNKGTLEGLRDVKLYSAYRSLQTDVIKSSLGMFLSEMLVVSLQEEEKNQPLFDFISKGFIWLDTNEKIANFHIVFLLELTKYLGFYPDTSGINYPYFDLKEGDFTPTLRSEVVDGAILEDFKKFLDTDFQSASEIKLNRQSRGLLLDQIIRYYQYHLVAFKKPKSLEILPEIFT
ncbi:DNA repair protein RecO [Galbibacter marinus]|uniref:DNA repair protein RecO n=1 Tax=Galbibacter marinus TaxID=555500 RepID=K2QKC4_9FLAO|nr:DNA repair protein RecO [Galbibacter marinus]EKF55157.1 DNA repair protein RecO [Galbibacter marinus]